MEGAGSSLVGIATQLSQGTPHGARAGFNMATPGDGFRLTRIKPLADSHKFRVTPIGALSQTARYLIDFGRTDAWSAIRRIVGS